jgi:uncharacterized protein YqeY
MSRINVAADILKHSDEEIIEYLAEEAKAIRATFNAAQKANRPELLYATRVDLEIITTVLNELDKRNKLRA